MDGKRIEQLLQREEEAERHADEAYWAPLKVELEQLRLNHRRRSTNNE